MRKKLKKLKVVLHPLFIVLGVLMMILGRAKAFFICTLSAFLHEWAHSIVAEKYGYKMERIRLMPFGAELYGDTDSFVDKDEIYIALAGPLSNFIICIIILGIWWISPDSYGASIDIFETNLVMGMFNLLPFFPLDGGRIILALISLKTTRRTGAKIVKNATKVFALTLFMGFLISILYEINLTLGIMGFLLFFSASASQRDAVYEKLSLLEMVKTKKVRWGVVSVPFDMPIYELRRLHTKNQVTVFKIINKDGMEEFSFSELELERVLVFITQDMKVGSVKRYIDQNL